MEGLEGAGCLEKRRCLVLPQVDFGCADAAFSDGLFYTRDEAV
ncbi:hypothetical protein HMPREF9123_2541 [Neisseria bacilliformis ATCC BAA-1200]|uniref:Uncharacterized protein n=1 Tax=Neisseria bacilliformis ATCC BAA-1200 TaxID=888742 RepID=F2BFN4_9NEIS|nr:hypothetical protein HMPREF9123_2541 [Neisseria bacilliformis ATCC BAA-1200]